MITIPRNLLRVGDYVLTTSRTLLACTIRAKTAGWRQFFNTRVATHAGIIYSLDGSDDPQTFFIAEMLSNIRSTAIREYEKPDFWNNHIVYVKRNPLYNDPLKRSQVNAKIISDLQKAVDYDYKGILEYIWPDAKDEPEKFYCSEYLRYLAQYGGGDIFHPKWRREDDIPPCGIQFALNLTGVWVA